MVLNSALKEINCPPCSIPSCPSPFSPGYYSVLAAPSTEPHHPVAIVEPAFLRQHPNSRPFMASSHLPVWWPILPSSAFPLKAAAQLL